MRKALIFILLIVSVSCTARRYTGHTYDQGIRSTEEIWKSVQKNNLTNESFYIEKGSFILQNKGVRNQYLFSVKFQKPEKYLISIKNMAGIEGARIFLTGDTLLINDRLNKKILFGEPKDVERISGINSQLICIFFGDIQGKINGSFIEQTPAIADIISMETIDGKRIESVIDLKLKKVLTVSVFNSSGKAENIKDSMVLRYSKYSKNEKHIPENITVSDIGKNILARMKIGKIQILWDGEIEFVPGKGYKIEKIK